jgi:hypothetical protein
MVAACASAFSVPAMSAPLQRDASLATVARPATQKVWCHGGCGGGGVGVGALIGGLVGGVIAAGAANAAAQQNAAVQQHAASCAQRYRSYDPASDTFAGKDGRRYQCQ